MDVLLVGGDRFGRHRFDHRVGIGREHALLVSPDGSAILLRLREYYCEYLAPIPLLRWNLQIAHLKNELFT